MGHFTLLTVSLMLLLACSSLGHRKFSFSRKDYTTVPIEALGTPRPRWGLMPCARLCSSQPRCFVFKLTGGLCELFSAWKPDPEDSTATGPAPPAGPFYQLTSISATYLAEVRWWRTTALLGSVSRRDAAIGACTSLGSGVRLTIIHSPEKNQQVSALLSASSEDGWLGMTTNDDPPYGYWDDQSPLDWINWDTTTDWEQPEPNGVAKEDMTPVHAAAIDSEGLWYDTADQLQNVPLCDQQLG